MFSQRNHSRFVGNNLKKSVYISNFLLILLAFSCGQNSSEKELNGNWRAIESEFSTWHFYPDSLVLKFPGESDEKTNWSADKSQIEFELPNLYWELSETPEDSINRVFINYELSENRDSLFGTLKNNWGVHKFSLLKTENYIQYLNRKFGIEFTLPKDSSAKDLDRNLFNKNPNSYNLYPIYGMRIFMGISNNKIIGKTEISENLTNLELDIKKFKDSIKPNEQHQIDTHEMFLDRRFHMRVFADKKISDWVITNHLKAIIHLKNSELDKHYPERFRGQERDTLQIRIYRIFESKNENIRNLKGKEIKTIANNVYSS